MDIKIKTSDLFKILKVIKKVGILEDLKGFIKSVQDKAKDKSVEELKEMQEDVGMDFVIKIISGLDLAEKEIYDLLASVEGKDIKEVIEQDPSITLDVLSQIMKSEVFMGFLNSVSK